MWQVVMHIIRTNGQCLSAMLRFRATSSSVMFTSGPSIVSLMKLTTEIEDEVSMLRRLNDLLYVEEYV